MPGDQQLAVLVRLVHQLELDLPYVTYEDVASRARSEYPLPSSSAELRALVDAALGDFVLLRDRRERFDPEMGTILSVELLRVNFVHPLVRRALGLEEQR